MDDQIKEAIFHFEPFTWKIDKFTKRNTKNLQSKTFLIGDHKWRIHLYPLTKNVDHFSLYLMVDGYLPAFGWSRDTYFKLVLINQLDSNKSVIKETHQKFNGRCRSWGSSFVKLSDFYDPKQGYLVENTCIIEAHVCVSNNLSTNQSRSFRKVSPPTPTGHDSKLDDPETEILEDHSGRLSTSSSTCGSSQAEEEIQGPDLTLRDLIDLDSLGAEAEAFIPLLEEACRWRPALTRSQSKRTSGFKIWAFTSLGKVLHILKTSQVRDMNEDASNHLESLWEELVLASGFDLGWLKPHVESALGLRAHFERTVAVNELKDKVASIEMKMEILKGELAAAQAEFEVASRDLTEARKGFIEVDLNAGLGYGFF